LDRSLPTEIRYLAIIQFKNGIDKYWRKTAPNAIKQDEKILIRLSLYEGGIGEADPQLALQNALAVSKVVRIDYPVDWPEALTSLIAILRTATESNQLHLRRGLLVLLQIIKELSTARLRRSQTSLQSVTPEIVFLLSSVYGQKVSYWLKFLDGSGDDEGGAMHAMENSLMALKTLRRLLIVGYEYPNHEKEVQEIWGQSQIQFGQFLDLVTREPPVISPLAKTMVEKHLVQLAKLHCQMADQHPAAFALLPNSPELTRAYWGLITKFGDIYGSVKPNFSAKAINRDNDMKAEMAYMEKISLKGLLILRSCVKMVFKPAHTFKYRTPEIKEQQNQAVNLVKTQLLTDDLVCQLADVIITKFFVFRQADLSAWEEVFESAHQYMQYIFV
jgi:Importin-beta N-terminal domain